MEIEQLLDETAEPQLAAWLRKWPNTMEALNNIGLESDLQLKACGVGEEELSPHRLRISCPTTAPRETAREKTKWSIRPLRTRRSEVDPEGETAGAGCFKV